MANVTIPDVVASTFLSTFCDGHTLFDLGPTLTCSEADALVDMINALGGNSQPLIDGHAMADDEGDEHWIAPEAGA